jgi:site-specific recombinase
LSYEITQHTAKTGEHYITESKTEYFKMLYAAVGGGLIVGLLALGFLLKNKT